MCLLRLLRFELGLPQCPGRPHQVIRDVETGQVRQADLLNDLSAVFQFPHWPKFLSQAVVFDRCRRDEMYYPFCPRNEPRMPIGPQSWRSP